MTAREGEPAPETALGVEAHALAGAIDAAVGPWLHAKLVSALTSAGTAAVPADLDTVVAVTRDSVTERMRILLEADIDAQRSTPLTVLRDCLGPANELLDRVGVSRPRRDDVTVRMAPDDHHDLAPATLADLGPDVAECGLRWGAAKAYVHLARRRAEGRIGPD